MESRINFRLSDNKHKIRLKSAQKKTNKDFNFKILNKKRPLSNMKNQKTIIPSINSINIPKKLINTLYLPILIKNNFNYLFTIAEILSGKKFIIQNDKSNPKLFINHSENENRIKKKDSKVFLHLKKNENCLMQKNHEKIKINCSNSNKNKVIKKKKEKIKDKNKERNKEKISIDCIIIKKKENKKDEIKEEKKKEEENKKDEVKEEIEKKEK